jgi:hypothetical protein
VFRLRIGGSSRAHEVRLSRLKTRSTASTVIYASADPDRFQGFLAGVGGAGACHGHGAAIRSTLRVRAGDHRRAPKGGAGGGQ